MASSGTLETNGVRIAIEGCGHGTLNAIYAAVDRSCKERNWDGVDLLIIGGDFQAVRNAVDMNVMSVPPKYRELGDFPEYYSGQRKAPYLTLFVAGNHEAASHLWELYYGGWVAPNIYYMGAANVLRLGHLRIAGMSGICKGFDYRKSHHERLPFNAGDVKSFYHVREIDVRKLLQLRTQVDIGISHDWPRAIEYHGDSNLLFKQKPFFRQESIDGTLGSFAAEYVLDRLRPKYWFSAHMHCKFSAIKTHEPPKQGEPSPEPAQPAPEPIPAANPDEIDLDLDEDDNEAPVAAAETSAPEPAGEATTTDDLRSQLPAAFAKPPTPKPKTTPGQPVPAGITNTTTRFLALDKCLPGRKFLQLMEIPSAQPFPAPLRLQYDPEWLAILRTFHPLLQFGDRHAVTPPDEGEAHYLSLIQENESWVEQHIVAQDKLDVPVNFALTAPPHNPGVDPERVDDSCQPEEYTNPQTAAFCELIGVENLWDASAEERALRRERGPDGPAPGEFQGGGRGRGRGRGGRGGGGGRGRGGRGGGRGRGWGGGGGGGRGWGRGQ